MILDHVFRNALYQARLEEVRKAQMFPFLRRAFHEILSQAVDDYYVCVFVIIYAIYLEAAVIKFLITQKNGSEWRIDPGNAANVSGAAEHAFMDTRMGGEL